MKWFCLCLLIGLSWTIPVQAVDTNAAPPATTATVLDGNILLLRTSQVTDRLTEALHTMPPTNRFIGIVLDIRFADGDAAPATVGSALTANKARLVVLVNGQTKGTAAELARQLRANGNAILIGSTNPPGKIVPDILVNQTAESERKFIENPYLSNASNNPSGGFAKGDLIPFVDHMSEAELVHRKIKDGEDLEATNQTPRPTAAVPVIRDPALARASDLLKAMALLRPVRG